MIKPDFSKFKEIDEGKKNTFSLYQDDSDASFFE